MAPKRKIKKSSRKVGLLGQPVYDSDEDEDWTPNERPHGVAITSAATKSTGSPRNESDGADSDTLDVPLRQRRKQQRRSQGGRQVDTSGQAADKSPRRSTRRRPESPSCQPPQPQQQQQQHQRASGARTRGRAGGAATAGGGAAITAGASTSRTAAGLPARDWSGLTEPLLASVLQRACAASALPTAAAAACVCRHWRDVCRDLEARAQQAAAAAASTAAAEEAAAALRALRAQVAAPQPGDAGATTSTAAPPFMAAAPTADPGDGDGPYSVSLVRGSDLEGADGGLWGCLDVRSRPSVRFDDAVVQAGLTSGRWMQVRTLRLRNCRGLTPDGLTALAGGCPGLTSLELTQCDSLVKLDAMRAALSCLPRLRLLDLSHCTTNMVDSVIRIALAPRTPPVPQQTHQQQTRVARSGGGDAADGGGGGRGSGGPEALPCPLRVLRARGCPRLGSGMLKALAPEVSYVTLPPWLLASISGRTTAGAATVVPVFVHLRELDLTGSGAQSRWGQLAVEKLQAAAPNLRVLRLDAVGSAVYGDGLPLSPEPDAPGPGFPQLRVCEMGLSRCKLINCNPVLRSGSTLSLLRRVVGRSPLLHTLDVSGGLSSDDHFLLSRDVPDAVRRSSRAGGIQEADGPDDAAAAEAAAVAEATALSALGPPEGGLSGEALAELRERLRQSLAPQLSAALAGPLRVLRASRSLLASDAALQALAARFGGTLQLVDVSESSHVTDAGLLHVATGCTALTSLDVSGTAVTDYGVKVLVALRGAPPVGMARTGGGAGGSSSGGGGAVVAAAPGRRGGAAVVDLISDSDEGEDDGGGGRGVAGGALGLLHLDINSCRGVDRALRHAAAEGLAALRRALGVG